MRATTSEDLYDGKFTVNTKTHFPAFDAFPTRCGTPIIPKWVSDVRSRVIIGTGQVRDTLGGLEFRNDEESFRIKHSDVNEVLTAEGKVLWENQISKS